MNTNMDLSVESLDSIEAPLTDLEWGLVAGAVLCAGVIVGAAIAT